MPVFAPPSSKKLVYFSSHPTHSTMGRGNPGRWQAAATTSPRRGRRRGRRRYYCEEEEGEEEEGGGASSSAISLPVSQRGS
mmetsp:Transcript_8959/g.17142  ORF Transcript_8959/g.17142 Transcript_8959/m.17142 type:complete len:81 (+) Transcript_8959:76-318(+)